LFKKAGWLLATIAFAGFIGVTFYKSITGQASCGCFGRVTVNPWITLFAMDVPLFLLLAIFRPKGEKLLPPPWPHPTHFFVVAILTALILGALVPTLIFNKPPDMGADYIVIKPDTWTTTLTTTNDIKPVVPTEPNQPVRVTEPNAQHAERGTQNEISAPPPQAELPQWKLMLEHVDIVDEISSGVVVVLFYHYDCPDCREAIPLYEQYSQQLASDDQVRFAFINAPPYSDDSEDIVSPDTSAILGMLDDSRDWIFETPLIFLLRDGDLIRWWQVEYPDLDTLLNTIITAH
jgi:thiol-disulfide isomerase/thioredoxin